VSAKLTISPDDCDSVEKIGILNHIFSRLLKYLEKYLDRNFFVLISQGGSFPGLLTNLLAYRR